MAVEKRFYKHSTDGYVVMKLYATNIKNSTHYFKNGSKADKSCMEGCVEIKEKKYNREMRKLKRVGNI